MRELFPPSELFPSPELFLPWELSLSWELFLPPEKCPGTRAVAAACRRRIANLIAAPSNCRLLSPRSLPAAGLLPAASSSAPWLPANRRPRPPLALRHRPVRLSARKDIKLHKKGDPFSEAAHFARSLCVETLQLRAGSYESLACLVVLVLVEVVDEASGEILCLLVPYCGI